MNWTQLYFPETSISHRLRAMKNWLVLAFLASASISIFPMLLNPDFSSVPFFNTVSSLNPLAAKICLGVFLALPLFILLSRKSTVFIVLFFLLGAFLVFYIPAMLKPWLYQYLIMFFVLAFYNWRVDEPKKYTPVFNTLKLCMVLLYVWAGTEKLMTHFNESTWPWMLSSWNDVLTPAQLNFFKKAGYVVPVAEILAGLSLLLPTLKRIGIPVLFLIHIITFLLMGPLGHSFNAAVWPWHLFMMIFLYVLFAGKAETKFGQWSFTFQFKPVYVVVLMLGILPALMLKSNSQQPLSSATVKPLNLQAGNTEIGTKVIPLESHITIQLSRELSLLGNR